MTRMAKTALVVLLVVFGLAIVIRVNVVDHPWSYRADRAKADVQRIALDGVEAFKRTRGRYPTTEEGLNILIDEKFLKANSPKGKLLDPWAREYVYRCPGSVHPDSFDVLSYGADGTPGGDGENADIVNQ